MSQKRVKRQIEWTIENVTRETFGKVGCLVLSTDPFILNLGDNITKWLIYIDVQDNGSKLFMGAWLQKISFTRNDFLFSLTFKLGDHMDESLSNETKVLVPGWGWSEFLELDKLFDRSLNYLDENSSMKLVAELEISYPDDDKPEGSNLTKRRKTFTSNFRDEEYADFTLKSSEGRAFKVHRLVLANNSEFFDKMFKTNMREKNKGEAVLQNVNSAMLEEVIKFIYTGKAEISDSKKAKEFLDTAEELSLAGLKDICEDQLLKDLNKKNALEMLTTADMFNAKKLEMESLEMIMSNYDTLKDTASWKLLTNPLLMKIMDALANKRDKIKFRSTF